MWLRRGGLDCRYSLVSGFGLLGCDDEDVGGMLTISFFKDRISFVLLVLN